MRGNGNKRKEERMRNKKGNERKWE